MADKKISINGKVEYKCIYMMNLNKVRVARRDDDLDLHKWIAPLVVAAAAGVTVNIICPKTENLARDCGQLNVH